MKRRSSQVALGGIFSALCLICMMITIIPFGTYALPVLAGALLFPVVIEVGSRTAVLVYISVSLLSVFLVPDKEAVMLFVVFFGYYPILKEKMEKLRPLWVERVVKFLVFNASVTLGYYITLYVIGVARMIEDFGEAGTIFMIIMLLMGNAFFFLYDIALTRYISLYLYRFRKKLIR